eukprot:TRINITY_DN25959_c0_g1_i2.p1 TRINITY_DN25959_c0_g1~~TRINITY_DN25959_c0_g1_i2.p1  ORF type:complete len:167 (-),score=45.38 TRINITY_DN25959_c0_g1_i2:88-588(-)
MMRRPPRSTLSSSSAASDVYKRQGTTWSQAQIEESLKLLEPQWPTFFNVADNLEAINRWNEVSNSLPYGLLRHVELCSIDVVLQNDRKEYRIQQHDASVLRTPDMDRYFALPYTTGPSVPTTLQQPVGVYPEGRYSTMNLSLIHISEPTRLLSISYAVFCLKKKKK